MNNQKIGKRIALLRQEQSLTQQQLAAMLNVSHQAVSKWESGQSLPDMDTLLELTRLFGITVEELMDAEGAQESRSEETEVFDAQDADMNNEEKKEAEKMNIMQLIRMAPFMSKDAVGEIAMQIETRMTAYQLARLAPFVTGDCLESLMEKHAPDLSWDTLRRLAPFLSKDYVDRIAKEIAGGERTVAQNSEELNRTINEIGKAFDGIGKDMSKAFDEIGRGVEKTVRKAIRFGSKVVNEVSSAIDEMGENVDITIDLRQRSERAASIRRLAFERAFLDGNWDWLGKHIEEIRGDAELMARIAEKAKSEGQHDWICRFMGGFADENTIDAAVADGRWNWLGDNCWQFGEAIQQKIALEAMRAENWQWLSMYSEQMKLGERAFEIAETAMRAGATLLAANIASAHLDSAQKNDLVRSAYETGNSAALDEMIDLADGEFRRWMLLDLADRQLWDQVEKYADEVETEVIEEACEKAVEQGNFDAIDMLDRFL